MRRVEGGVWWVISKMLDEYNEKERQMGDIKDES